MKIILGNLIIVVGVMVGLYIGLYLMLYGGIMQIINGINPVNAKDIAIGILRILFSEIGAFPAYLGVSIGIAIKVS